jgi:hypothetical protein
MRPTLANNRTFTPSSISRPNIKTFPSPIFERQHPTINAASTTITPDTCQPTNKSCRILPLITSAASATRNILMSIRLFPSFIAVTYSVEHVLRSGQIRLTASTTVVLCAVLRSLRLQLDGHRLSLFHCRKLVYSRFKCNQRRFPKLMFNQPRFLKFSSIEMFRSSKFLYREY